MSNEWGGGKGDRNRVDDRTAYADNYDKIFGKASAVEDAADVMSKHEPDIYEEIIQFLKHIDLEEYPVQKAKELYKKFLTHR